MFWFKLFHLRRIILYNIPLVFQEEPIFYVSQVNVLLFRVSWKADLDGPLVWTSTSMYIYDVTSKQ